MGIENWKLEKLKGLAENAKGRAEPWCCNPMTHRKGQLRMFVPYGERNEPWYVGGEAITDFISAASPETILALLAEIERLQARAIELPPCGHENHETALLPPRFTGGFGHMKIVIDTREQRPFTFAGDLYAGVETESAALAVGDYSLAGLTDRVAVERKELSDLVQCLGRERERFLRELQRAAALDCFAVVVEADWQQLARGEYRSRLNPHSACQSVMAFTARYRIPFHFAGSRAAAEYCTWSLLRQYLEGAKRRLKAIVKAHEAA